MSLVDSTLVINTWGSSKLRTPGCDVAAFKGYNLINEHLFRYLELGDFHKLSRINRFYHQFFWSLILDRWLAKSPFIKAVPSITTPYIPKGYLENRILADRAQQLDKHALAITEALHTIQPYQMGKCNVMQGILDSTPFYLIRYTCEDSEGLLILFKYLNKIYVTDTLNKALESYHPFSPIAYSRAFPLFYDLITNKCAHAIQFRFNSIERFGVSRLKTQIRLWTPSIETDNRNLLQRILSFTPAIERDGLNKSHFILAVRTSLIACSIFAFFPYGVPLAAAAFYAENRRAKSAVLKNRVLQYFQNPTPELFKIIASSPETIHLLKDDLNRKDSNGFSLLHYCTQKDIRSLLIRYGAEPNSHFSPLNPFMYAVQQNDLETLQDYLQYYFTFSPVQEKKLVLSASIPAIELILQHRPHFNLDACDDTKKSALDELLYQLVNTPISNENDLQCMRHIVEKIFYLITHGANSTRTLLIAKTMKMIAEKDLADVTPELLKVLEAPRQLAWTNSHALSDVLDKFCCINYR